jgi:glycosyltransferase involved in cell wall biosynthesis
MPDFLVFSALIPKLRGSRIILDLHDPMPELMMSIYRLATDDWKVRFLRMLERRSIGFATLAITPNIAFKKLFVSRGCPPQKMHIIMNTPQPEIFHPDLFEKDQSEPRKTGEFRVMHHGLIAHRHGVDLLVEAIARVRPSIPNIQLDIYGGHTPFLDIVLATASRLGVADRVHYHGSKSQTEIAEAIRRCHLGVVPNRRSTFTETNFPTRLFEYLAMHRPVIAPSTEGIRDYFGAQQILFFEPGNVDDLAAQILWTWEHPLEAREIVRAGIEIYRQHLWSEEKVHFVNLVSTLCART